MPVRLAILSDIHEDYKRLRRVFKKIGQIGCDICACLGDISGYSDAYYRYHRERNAHACLEMVREQCEIIIPGNHDLHAAGRIPDLPHGVDCSYWPHEKDLDPGFSEEDLAFLAGLPEYAVLPDTTYKILLSHYIDPNLSGIQQGFFTRGKEFATHFQLMQDLDCRVGISGHAHARGLHLVFPEHYRHYGYRRLLLDNFPVVVGIPPVTRHKKRSGFCIFDTKRNLLQAFKIY